jgi:hypothetical protein
MSSTEHSEDQLQGLCPHGNFPTSCEICKQSAQSEVVQRSNDQRSLAYKPEIKEAIDERPGIIKDSLNLISELEKKGLGSQLEQDGLRVTYFNARNWSHSFKLETNGQTYFVRKERGRDTGAKAMAAFEEANRRLEGRDDIRTIDSQLGYTDAKGNDYFVAKWEDLLPMGDYLSIDYQGPDSSEEEKAPIREKVVEAYSIFRDFNDVGTWNMFYDPKTKQVVMYDLEQKEEKASS